MENISRFKSGEKNLWFSEITQEQLN